MNQPDTYLKRLLHQPWSSLFLPLAFVSLAALLRIWPLQVLGSTLAWATFYPAVIVSAFFGGLAAGLMAAALSCVTVAFLWPLLVAQPFIAKPADLIGMAMFATTCTLIAFLTHVMHRANARATMAQEKAELAYRSLSESLNTIAQNERFIKSITDATPGMIAYWDKDLYCRFANKAYLEWFGRPPEAVIGRKIQDLMGETLYAKNAPFIAGALAGKAQSFERALTKADASIGYTWAQYIPDLQGDGTVAGFYVLVSDVTRLVQSEANVRSMMDNLPYMTWLKDAQGRYVAINKVFANFFGLLDPQHALGKTDLDLHPQDLAEKYRADDKDVMASRQQKHVEESVFDGERLHWVETYKTAVIGDGGQVLGTVGFAQDISERKNLEAELRIAARAFESREAMIITDAQSVILKVNPAFTQSTGYSAEEVVGKTPRILRSSRHSEDFYLHIWDAIHRDGGWEGEIWDRRKNGEEYTKWLTISAVTDDAGKVTHYIGIQHDISDLKNAEANLRELNQSLEEKKEQLRELVAKNEAIREEERGHVAREVHDELGQVLTALRMDLSFLSLRFGVTNSVLDEKVLGMRKLVDDAILAVRNVASNLRPAVLDLGLAPAIEWLASEFSQRTGIACKLSLARESFALDEASAIVVFRIVQESLTNVTRYAQASEVSIAMTVDHAQLHVEIRDNGQGFTLENTKTQKSFGLLGMEERALSLGGNLSIHTAPGQGTTIQFNVPSAAMKKELPQ